jgi:hypothetical protein
MRRVQQSFARNLKAANGIGWLHTTGPAPIAELRDIDTAIARLAVIDPRLRTFEFCPDLPLGESGIFPQLAKKCRNGFVQGVMLGFGRQGDWNRREEIA